MKKKIRPNYYGCVDSLPKDDKRLKLFKEQRKTRGFDDTELWSLDCAVFKFLKPRLKALIKKRVLHFSANVRTDHMKKLSKILEAWDESSLLDDEAYELLSKTLGAMWY